MEGLHLLPPCPVCILSLIITFCPPGPVSVCVACSVSTIARRNQAVHHFVPDSGLAAGPRAEESPVRHCRLGRGVGERLHHRHGPPMPTCRRLLALLYWDRVLLHRCFLKHSDLHCYPVFTVVRHQR